MEQLDGVSDEELLLKSRLRPWYFEALIERYREPFLRKARRFVYDPRDSEEVVLDAFTKIYMHADSFQPQEGAKFSSWAYRILVNTACTRYQQNVKRGQRYVDLDPETEALVRDFEALAVDERKDAVERVLARMPGHFAAVLRLHYLERWSHQDIADTLGEQVGAVKVRVHRAKAAFKKTAREDEVSMLLGEE